ncbi:segregation and condensation protein A [Leuconostoc lactis]|uniref:segregation and condensation protein A n=1 Tax=Leuconostoc lactis TaxID=1246 RepID=UPI00241DEEC1|nr:segregation/condensation protein A [Leuconostoc lactis]
MEKSNIVAQHLTIKLSDFEGPLDLLLHLIKKSELDIFDLPIATITAQYLAFIQAQQDMQLDVASEYLVMAATLVQIKSADLLPQETYDDDMLVEELNDPRDELMRQLLTYKQFQAASAQLRERECADHQSFARLPMAVPADFEPDMALAPGLGLVDLQVAFAKLLRKKRQHEPISRRVVREKMTMAHAVANIRQHFAAHQVGDMLPFESLFDQLHDRESLVMTFIALLEMAKEDQVILHQTDAQAEIFVEIENIDGHE